MDIYQLKHFPGSLECYQKMIIMSVKTKNKIKGVGGGKDLISLSSFVFTYVIDLSFLVSKSGQ